MSYVLLVDEYRSKGGMNLIAALEEVKQYATGSEDPAEITAEAVERKNAEALSQLDQMMKGVR